MFKGTKKEIFTEWLIVGQTVLTKVEMKQETFSSQKVLTPKKSIVAHQQDTQKGVLSTKTSNKVIFDQL